MDEVRDKAGAGKTTGRGWRTVTLGIARRVGFIVLVALALVGAWSIYQWYRDPIRLAQGAVDDGSAAKLLSAQLAKQRACAPLLDGVEPFESYRDPATLPSVQALLAAGLIEPVPAGERPEGVRNPLFRTTRAAAPYLSFRKAGDRRFVELCYGRPKLGWVYLETDGSTHPSPMMRFKYFIGDRPAWADRADMRAAFPFLNELTGEPVLHYLGIRFRGTGTPVVSDTMVSPEMDVDAAVSGFSFCPPEASAQPDACKRRSDD
ncbi:hypothetical protein DMC47_04265 [Nostoc sp. 3335mG]|nr:hypothetical protein DMC47_04265 [Nostoc sp. 3335mG]